MNSATIIEHESCIPDVSGVWINNYVAKLNNECRTVSQYKIAWTANDLQPSNIRKYCRKIGEDTVCTGF